MILFTGVSELHSGGTYLTPAAPADVPGLARLLLAATPECVPQSQFEIERFLETYVVARAPSGLPVGCVSLRPLPDLWRWPRVELRALCVHPDWRGSRLGGRLVQAVIDRSRELEAELVCVSRSPEYFERFGFSRLPLDELPPKRGAVDDPERPRAALVLSAEVCV